MSASATFYDSGLRRMADGTIAFLSDTVKCALFTSAYTPAVSHQYLSDTAHQLSGGNYPAGGVALSGKTSASSGSIATLSADDPLFAALTAANVRYAAFYKPGASAATSPLLCYMDFGTTLSMTSRDFLISLDGIIRVTAI